MNTTATAARLDTIIPAPLTRPADDVSADAFPAADMLPVQRRATFAFRLGKAIVSPLLNALFSFEVEGLENVPADGSNYVLIANHLHSIDSIVILKHLPCTPRVHFLGDPTGLRHHLFQWWFVRKMGGLIPVNRAERSGPQLFDHVHRCLDRGGVVALYPEGRCGDVEGELLPFKKGFAHFALRAAVPVLPVALSGHRRLWFRKHLVMRVGAMIDTTGMDVDTLVERGHDAVRDLLPVYRERGGRRHLMERFLTGLI